MLDQDFVMNFFEPLYENLPDLKDYLNYHLEEKVGNGIGSNKPKERVKAIEEAILEFLRTLRIDKQLSSVMSWLLEYRRRF